MTTQDSGSEKALSDARRLLLWRAYVGLLQSLAEVYRVRPDAALDPASEQTWLQSLAEFNPQMAELLLIEQARADQNHWLHALVQWWRGYWQAAQTTPASSERINLTGTEVDWALDARNGLAAWATELAKYSQTN
ncbi:MAG: hypothetical protein LAT62_03865 [Natronospirillum sp.]|uniref:hypothetical protein n=1 Tax=Natronospirillum sp. TaxID=2812955 RepID=UPI0025D1BFAB|nr:hypothetical protein [Natronospirillum sp.]MCH8551049.1 hypothetical protein [Natronospirillum sp.]